MIACISILLLWTQVNAGKAIQYGTVSGVLKTEAGTPAAGVRVAAIPQPQDPDDIAAGSALASIAETDETGRYRLEDIPIGRYFIVAGRVDGPTYFPGVLDKTAGTAVVVTAGAKAQGIDFVMRSSSVRTASPAAQPGGFAQPSLGISVNVESRSKVPVSGPGGVVVFRLTDVSDGRTFDFPMSDPFVTLPGASAGRSFLVSVERLPEGYRVTSMKFGSAELPMGVLKTDPNTLGRLGTSTFAASTGVMMLYPDPITLTVAADPVSTPNRGGVRVTGRLPGSELHLVLLSGNPGTVFSDRTFEFRNVPPGRHTVAFIRSAVMAPLRRAASIVVGDRDIDGIQFEETPLLPVDIAIPAPPRSAGSRPAGSVVRLASFRGRFVESDTVQPIANGTVYLIGDRNAELSLDADGRFEVQHLLPGTYNLEAQIPGYRTVQKVITVDTDDVDVIWNLP